MGGGLMQLVAYGAQDIYLTGNPQITFFKVVYRRHTNFSMEAIEQTWNGNVAAGSRVSATVSRNGDLVHRMYIDTGSTFDPGANNNNPTAQYIDNIVLEIGGQQIDKQYGSWMEVWAELTEPNPTGTTGTTTGTGGTLFQNMSGMGGVQAHNGPTRKFVPLQFWFCRNPGLALPLIALQYHEVKVIIQFSSGQISYPFDGLGENKLWADYIYLDTDERRRFAQVSHEYLIEQVQVEQGKTVSAETTLDLNFNHPVKELIWTPAWDANNGFFFAGAGSFTAAGNWQLKLNGHDRFAARAAHYFTRTQVWQHHTGYGGITVDTNGADAIAVYSFALKPEEHQPSGTCNFSRIDNAQLTVSSGESGVTSIDVYAVNYNVLRIMSGMGGLAYSN